MNESPRSVAVWSPKGGVGKTVIAVALALKLAERQPTALVDGNADNPDIVTLLQCPGHPNVTNWPEVALLEEWSTLLTHHAENLWVLPGPSRFVEADSLSHRMMTSILQTCTGVGMRTIVDLGSSMRDATLAALDSVDQILVPVTLDLLTISPLRRLTRELDLLRIPRSKFRVIINRHTNTREITVDDISTLVEFPVAGIIPSARELATAINRGEARTALSGTSPMGRAMAALVDSWQGDPDPVTQKGRGLLSGWLARKGEK